MSATVRGLCVNNSHPIAGAVLARLAKDRRSRMGPPSAPPAAVAGDGVQTLPGRVCQSASWPHTVHRLLTVRPAVGIVLSGDRIAIAFALLLLCLAYLLPVPCQLLA